MTIHKTVLLDETVDALKLKKGAVVIDATLGGGGHSMKVLQQIGDSGFLIALDKDSSAIKRFEDKLVEVGKSNVVLVNDSFVNLSENLAHLQRKNVDAIVADFGISSDQLDDPQRGMTFLKEGPLDMRMDQAKGKTASDIVNDYSEKDLANILKRYGDEKYANSIAKRIVEFRVKEKISSTLQLVSVIATAVPEKYKHQRIHFATRTFQALRIEVNEELSVIEPFLSQAIDALMPGGRLSVITFHSGEDAIVKKVFRENARGCICPPELPLCRCGQKPKIKIITKKPIVPSIEETEINPRSRSAKLRVIEKV